MAVFYKDTGTNGFRIRGTVTENSTSIAGNSSNVTVELALASVNGTHFSMYEVEGSIKIDGSTVASYDDYFQVMDTGVYHTICSWTGDITHNTDGSRNIAVIMAMAAASGTYSPGSATISETVALTTISRKSEISGLTAAAIEDGVSVAVSKKSSSFYDVMRLTVGGTEIGTAENYASGAVIPITDAGLMAVYSAAGTGLTATVTATVSTYTSSAKTTLVGTDAKSAALPIGGTARVKVSGAWKRGVVYVKSGGAWKPGVINAKRGSWRRGI